MLSVLFTTVLALSALYLPQPLLPVLTREFGVSRETAALLTTITFLPLSLSPLFYGVLLETFSIRRVLRWAVFLLAVAEILVFFTSTFNALLILRLVQGLLVPALLTGLMTCATRLAPDGDVPKAMAWYVSATIFGGFSGRFLSGMIATSLNWRFSFVVLGLSLAVAWVWLGTLSKSGALTLQKPNLRAISDILAEPVMRTGYAMVFCFFLVFAAMMNYLPFRLTELSPLANEFRIGAAYVGYLFGIVMSLSAVRLQKKCGGARNVMVIALMVYVAALLVMMVPSVAVLICGMFLLCGAMFLTHSSAAGFLSQQVSGRQAVANGLYVSFYYAGGAVGSYLPGYAYRGFGWPGYMVILLMVACLALFFAHRLARSAL